MKTTEKLSGKSPASNPDWRIFALLLIAAVALIVLRRPDAILNPQFWAEDGKLFYADVYNKGLIIPFLSPSGGYLDTFPRLVAAFSQLFPLSWAPFLFNLALLLVKVMPVGLILSSRYCELIPDVRTRLFLAFLYLALPNSWEISAAPGHGKTYLSLLTFMILSASPRSHPMWLLFDTGIVLLSGLSGPFCIMLTPISALYWLSRRDRRSLMLFVLVGACAIIQVTILMTGSGHSHAPLGATPELFLKILSGQVFLGALIGQRGFQLILHSTGLFNLIVIVFGVLGLMVLIKVILEASLELRLFLLYALLLFCAALLSPLVNKTDPQWPLLLIPGVGGRYWFIPMLAFVSVLVWLLRRSGLSKALAVAAFSIMIIGIILDWRHPSFKDLNFREHASRFESAPIGTKAVIPINPEGWTVTLLKH